MADVQILETTASDSLKLSNSGTAFVNTDLIAARSSFSISPSRIFIDLRIVGIGGSFVFAAMLLGRKQDFVQPLTGPHPGEHNLHVMTDLKARQLDHSLGQFDNLDRLPHVEDIN